MEEQSKPGMNRLPPFTQRNQEDYFQEGDKLPSEKGFVNISSESITVRRALQTLENENLIYRKQGLGAFVMARKTESPLIQLTDFAEDLKERAIKHRQKLFVLKNQS